MGKHKKELGKSVCFDINADLHRFIENGQDILRIDINKHLLDAAMFYVKRGQHEWITYTKQPERYIFCWDLGACRIEINNDCETFEIRERKEGYRPKPKDASYENMPKREIIVTREGRDDTSNRTYRK